MKITRISLQFTFFCFKAQDRRRPKADSEGEREGWIDEQSYQIDQYEARVLRCTHVERPSPGPEAGLLTLMMVYSSGVFVFLGQR